MLIKVVIFRNLQKEFLLLYSLNIKNAFLYKGEADERVAFGCSLWLLTAQITMAAVDFFFWKRIRL